ncbi:MAG: M48 family metallopeptidase [Candidatus Heimdallarchaeota archaeon]
MYLNAFMDVLSGWFSRENLPALTGYAIAIFCGIFMLTELYSILTQKNEPDLFMMLLAGVIGGLIQGITRDALLAILAALCWLMIYSLWTIRQSPVWRELMLASLISYMVVLGGRFIMVVLEWHARTHFPWVTHPEQVPYWGLTGQQWFGISWNIFIYIFIILCLIFFGRRFFLVSRLTSPQVIYLFLFALSYFILYRFAGAEGLNFSFPGVPEEVGKRVLFASFGTYEIMICTNILLYIVSGPLLHVIFGVKKVKDERILKLVEEVKAKLNIRGKVRVGEVKAPILNAFAFGAFFDKRIAFMAKDLSNFSDDDIRGIAGHELAHSKRVHTLWLMVISAVTFAITKAIQLPATPLDYIFNPNVGLDFLWYYLYNIALLAFSYVFIRFLEGRADNYTMRAGFGSALAKSLIKLDGFYQGIASEMGLSVYLLTNKEQTSAERLRFLGDAGRNMYQNYIHPSWTENFINLIASHPKSAYRVVALTEQEKLRPFKAAILPFLLILPGVRKRFVKELQAVRSKVAPIINATFNEQYPKTGIKNYDKLSHLTYQYKYFEKKDVVAISKIDKAIFYTGKVKKIALSNMITSPLTLTLETPEGPKELLLSDYNIFEMAVGQKQVLKNGLIVTIKEITTKKGKFAFTAEFTSNNGLETKDFSVPGVPLSYLKSVEGKAVIFAQKGITRLAELTAIEFAEKNFGDSKLIVTGKRSETFAGNEFIVAFKPFDVYIKKVHEKEQRSLIEYLKGKPAAFQTKDDLDTLAKGTVTDVKEDSLILQTLDEIMEIKLNRIEFLYLYEDTLALLYKPSLSFIERLLMRFQNRRKLTYIYS